jgi:hypothetical protein
LHCTATNGKGVHILKVGSKRRRTATQLEELKEEDLRKKVRAEELEQKNDELTRKLEVNEAKSKEAFYVGCYCYNYICQKIWKPTSSNLTLTPSLTLLKLRVSLRRRLTKSMRVLIRSGTMLPMKSLRTWRRLSPNFRRYVPSSEPALWRM